MGSDAERRQLVSTVPGPGSSGEQIILHLDPPETCVQKGLLDRLSLYLRARIPAVREIHRVHRDGVDIY